MLRYVIHTLALLCVWLTLSVMPTNAGPCLQVTARINQQTQQLRAPQPVAQHDHGEHGHGTPCSHGNCSICCAVCSVASAAPAVITPTPLLVGAPQVIAHDPPPEWNLPDMRLSLLPFRPPR